MLNALADLFNIGPELSKGNPAQLVCPMTEDAFRYLAEQRYRSRSVALASDSRPVETLGRRSWVYCAM